MSADAPAAARGWVLLTLGAASALAGSLGCSVGQGLGYVRSDDLYVDRCYEGPFDLQPTFFGANPFNDTLTIRVQRGEQDILVSDGFTLLVYDVPTIRRSALDTALPLGLPVGVSPLGFPLPDSPRPPGATLSLYLNNSCRSQNSVLASVRGSVTFSKLFSGNPNEENSDDRITNGSFQATVVDPRHAIPDVDADGNPTYTYPDEWSSEVEGSFNFVFHRGTPAQPFP